jgi:hypothetical protein
MLIFWRPLNCFCYCWTSTWIVPSLEKQFLLDTIHNIFISITQAECVDGADWPIILTVSSTGSKQLFLPPKLLHWVQKFTGRLLFMLYTNLLFEIFSFSTWRSPTHVGCYISSSSLSTTDMHTIFSYRSQYFFTVGWFSNP